MVSFNMKIQLSYPGIELLLCGMEYSQPQLLVEKRSAPGGLMRQVLETRSNNSGLFLTLSCKRGFPDDAGTGSPAYWPNF